MTDELNKRGPRLPSLFFYWGAFHLLFLFCCCWFRGFTNIGIVSLILYFFFFYGLRCLLFCCVGGYAISHPPSLKVPMNRREEQC